MNDYSEEEDISFENDFDEEEDEEEKDLITIRLENIQIQINYSQLCKYSQLIRTKYLISDVKNNLPNLIQEFQRQNQIEDENIIFFFNILRDEKNKITRKSYRDLFKLSQFFKANNILKKLKKYSKSHFNDIDLRIQLILDEIEREKDNNSEDYSYELTVQMEDYLIRKINDCFNSFYFNQLPVSIIYQIIEKSDRQKINDDALFDFINKSIDSFFYSFQIS